MASKTDVVARKEQKAKVKRLGQCGHEIARALRVKVKGRARLVWICLEGCVK